MPIRNYVNYRLPIPQAARLGSLGGIADDLEGVIEYCTYLASHLILAQSDLLIWEAVSSAVVVRYARCFGTGVRESLPAELFSEQRLREAHEYFVALRSKHVAHSVNDFEDNEVVAQVDTDSTSSREIQHVQANHSRIVGLGSNDPAALQELAEYALRYVAEATKEAQRELLAVVHSLPLEQIKAFGSTAAYSGGTRDELQNLGRRRDA